MSGDVFGAPFGGLSAGPGRPLVVANAAASLDGKLARRDGRPLLLSDDADLARVHAMRAEADAILVGIGTVLADDPALTVRAELLAGGGSVAGTGGPRRVVLDTDLRTPPGARVVDSSASTLLYCRRGYGNPSVAGGNVRVVEVPEGRGGVHLPSVLADLAGRGVERLMVEGGSRVLTSFLSQGLADRFLLYVSPMLVGEGAPPLYAREGLPAAVAPDRLGLVASRRSGEGTLLALEPRPPT